MEISKEMKKTVNEIKRKLESLQASYKRERRLEVSTRRSGAGADEVFHSKWFAFKAMQFLNDKFSPREIKYTIDVSTLNLKVIKSYKCIIIFLNLLSAISRY
jgi:hypothetical protein